MAAAAGGQPVGHHLPPEFVANAAERFGEARLQARGVARLVCDGRLQHTGSVAQVGDHGRALSHEEVPAERSAEGEVVAHPRERLAARQALPQRFRQRAPNARQAARAETVAVVFAEQVQNRAESRHAVVRVQDAGDGGAALVGRHDDVRARHRAAEGYAPTHAEHLLAPVASAHHLELDSADVAVELRGHAGGVPVRPAALPAPTHGEHLQVRAVLEQALDQHQIVAGLVIPIHAGGREGAQQVQRPEHQPRPPAHRLPPDRDPPTRPLVRQGEAVETVPQAGVAALGEPPRQVEQAVAIAARRLLEDKPRPAAEARRVAANAGRGVGDDHAQRAAVALPHQAQVGVVIDQRGARGTAQRVATRQRDRPGEPLAAHLEHARPRGGRCRRGGWCRGRCHRGGAHTDDQRARPSHTPHAAANATQRNLTRCPPSGETRIASADCRGSRRASRTSSCSNVVSARRASPCTGVALR